MNSQIGSMPVGPGSSCVRYTAWGTKVHSSTFVDVLSHVDLFRHVLVLLALCLHIIVSDFVVLWICVCIVVRTQSLDKWLTEVPRNMSKQMLSASLSQLCQHLLWSRPGWYTPHTTPNSPAQGWASLPPASLILI